ETPTTAYAQINVLTLRNTLNNNGNVRISTASGASAEGNITFDAVLDYNSLGTTRTLTLEADGQIIFTEEGGIWDSDTGTANGLNFVATAGTGITITNGIPVDDGGTPGSGVINTGTGTIDITVT